MNKRITNDERAVSGLVGEIMLIGVVIVAIGLITVSTYSYLNKDPDPPHIEVNGLANLAENEIHLKHQGGESIEGGNLRVLVRVNGTTLSAFDENNPDIRWGLRENGIGNFDRWSLGDILVLDTWMTDHVNLTEDSDIRVTIVHRPSNRVAVCGEVFGGLFGDASLNKLPVAYFDCPTNGLCEDNITWTNISVPFNGTGSYDWENLNGGVYRGIVSWDWEFEEANGTTTTDHGMSVSHTYDTDGKYDVKLTVTDVDNGHDTYTCKVTIKPPAELTADAGDDQWVGIGATVQFNGSGSTGCIANWTWDFGDGNSTTVNASTTTHTYTNTTPQNYTVNLTVVEDHTGNTSTDTAIVNVTKGFLIVQPHEGEWVHDIEQLIEAYVLGMNGFDHTDFSIRSVSSEANYSLDVTDDSGDTFTSNTTSYTDCWNTSDIRCGNHTINATAYNTDDSEMGTDQITVCVCNLPGLVGFWRFDNIVAGGIADDSSCNRNHGAIVGNPAGVIDGEVYAYQFDGSGDHVEVANSASLAMTDETTVDAWVNSSDAGEQYVLAKGDMVFESSGVVIEGGNETVGQNTSTIDWPAFGVGHIRAQTFELAGDATLHGVKVELKRGFDWVPNPVTGDIKVCICTDGGTQPGIEVANATIQDSDVSTADYGWIDATFNCSLMRETIYWLMLESPDGTNSGWSYYWRADTTDPYSGGEAQYYDGGSWVSGYESTDMTFQLNITTTPHEGPVSTYTNRISMPDPDNFKFLIYYAWLNSTNLNLNWSESGLELIMVKDSNRGEIEAVQDAGVKVYYYIALGKSYNETANKTEWEQNVTDEMDAHNYTDGFVWDELDSGYYGGVACRPDFNERLDRLNGHADEMGLKTVANGVRYYAVHNGSDYYLWESFMSTYSGADVSNPDYYYYVDFFDRLPPAWITEHNWINGIEKWEYLRDNGVLDQTLVHSFGEPGDDDKSIYDYIASRVLGVRGFSYADSNNFVSETATIAEGLRWDLGTRMSYDVDVDAGTLSGRFTNGYVINYVNGSYGANSTNYITDLISDPLTAHKLNNSSRVTGLDFCLIRGQVDFMHGVLRSSTDLTEWDPGYHVLSATLDAQNGTAALYINNTIAAERTFPAGLPFDFSNQNLIIGTNGTGNYGFNGRIDDIMIYNYAT